MDQHIFELLVGVNRGGLSMRFIVCVCIVLIALPCWSDEMAFLGVRGKDIVDSEGRVVSMRGINFGSWLMMETWIPSLAPGWNEHLLNLAAEAGIEPELKDAFKEVGRFDDDTMTIRGYTDRLRVALSKRVSEDKGTAFWQKVEKDPPIVDARTLDRLLRQRFGDNGAMEIWDAFHNVWITEEEFKQAKELGFNFVRIPFWYLWFEDDTAPYVYKEYGFRWLDKAMRWARAHDIYVMLDLHGAVGGQNPWSHTGDLSRGELFKNEEYQKRTYGLWKTIANRYREEPAVFAYGCLNEPFSAKDLEEWKRVHDGIYRAIRSVDDRHIIIMEDGYKLEDLRYTKNGFFPRPDDMGWKHVIYSFHFYQTGDRTRHERRAKAVLRMGKREQTRCNVPIYLGEFNTISDTPESITSMGYYMTLFNQQGWHWSPWTFKFTGAGKSKTLWGVYQYSGAWDVPDVHRDTKEALLGKISRLAAPNFHLHEPYAAELKRCLTQPVVSAEEPK
jgi:hypothetical protein